MLRRLYETARHETRFVVHIAARDLAKRIAAFGLISFVAWLSGAPEGTLALVACLAVLSEISAQILARIKPEREEDFTPAFVLAMWTTNVASSLVYLWPSVLLASQPSLALLLAGFMWLFGVYVHISNTYIALPFYNWSLMIPGFGAALAVFGAAMNMEYIPSSMVDWWIAATLLLVYAANTYETMTTQKDTQRALSAARAEANARLRALEHMTRHDGLTGLLSRRAFDEALALKLVNPRGRQGLAVYIIDLDGFKPINDSYSHEAGDKVLIVIAGRLRELAGAEGLVSRLGGDEFALAVPGLQNGDVANRLAETVARRVAAPIDFRGKPLRVSCSIGVAMTGEGLGTVSLLCAAADQAMYRAKSDHEQRHMIYDPAAFPPRLSLQDRAALAEALATRQIRPWYQPKVRLDTGALIGFEALARWEMPSGLVRSPAQFLPLIEEFGMQGDFLTSMAAQVLEDVTALLADGLDPGQVSLNVPEVALATHSGRAELERLLRETPEAARYITFEITEDVFIARAGPMIQASIAAFRATGVRISLDDFGTGFASFQHLRQLEFDELKIDVSFVQGLGVDPAAEVLVAGFLQIAGGLGVSVIAEGVETDDQRSQLLHLGCTYGQGWRFGRAAPLAEARIRLFAERSRIDETEAATRRRRELP